MPTVTRRPRMHGRPPMTSGSRVIRFRLVMTFSISRLRRTQRYGLRCSCREARLLHARSRASRAGRQMAPAPPQKRARPGAARPPAAPALPAACPPTGPDASPGAKSPRSRWRRTAEAARITECRRGFDAPTSIAKLQYRQFRSPVNFEFDGVMLAERRGIAGSRHPVCRWRVRMKLISEICREATVFSGRRFCRLDPGVAGFYGVSSRWRRGCRIPFVLTVRERPCRDPKTAPQFRSRARV